MIFLRRRMRFDYDFTSFGNFFFFIFKEKSSQIYAFLKA